jgi:hypothetical protein
VSRLLARCRRGLRYNVTGRAASAACAGSAAEAFQGSAAELCLAPRATSPTSLRLLVGWEHVVLVLAPERLRLRGRRIEQTRTLADRVGGSVWHERKLAAGSPIGNYVAAVDIAAELDVSMLDHAAMMTDSTVRASRDGQFLRRWPARPDSTVCQSVS